MTGPEPDDDLEKTAKRAETLMHAAAELERIAEVQEMMEDDGELPDDEATEMLAEDIETAQTVCERLSVTLTMALAQEGFVPDFDDAPWDRVEADADDDSGFGSLH